MIAALLWAAAAAGGPLAAFEPWLDRCWTAKLQPGELDTHCFGRVYGGAHVRDRHRVTNLGKTTYEGETVYSADGDTISFVYYSSIGGVGHGTARPVPGGFDFPLTMRATPRHKSFAATIMWRWTGPDSYSSQDGRGVKVVYERDRSAEP